MPVRHVVVQGDGISKIAEQYGLNPVSIWDLPENSELRRERPDPNVLLPGDVLVIPDKQPGAVFCATGKRHRFRRLCVPALFELRLLAEDDSPRAALPYTLWVDGVAKTGVTDGMGVLRQFVPCSARHGLLRIGEVDGAEEYEVEFGLLNPASDMRGVQQRLRNLGFPCPDDGDPGGETEAALRRFQTWAGLPATGVLDGDTKAALQRYHDGRETPAPTPGRADAHH
jgi:N-acetylmuramoyl-L-alanine amidase